MKTIKILFIFCCFFSCKEDSAFKLKEGYILFQDLDNNNIDQAIEKVTKTALNYNFTHVGIVVKDNNDLKVLEAISTGVQITKIQDFFDRSLKNGKPKVVVGELNPEFRFSTKEAINYGKKLIGLPYDSIYKIGDNAYYCSELLYEMYHKVNPNTETFHLNPMTFKDTETNETLPFWKEYYKNLNHKIPEGEPGLNPNGMSVSPNLTLIYDYISEKEL